MQNGIEEGRDAIQGLRSSDFDASDLVLALSRVRQEFAPQPDMDFRVTVVGRQQPLRPPFKSNHRDGGPAVHPKRDSVPTRAGSTRTFSVTAIGWWSYRGSLIGQCSFPLSPGAGPL
jgi:hypothetical protein